MNNEDQWNDELHTALNREATRRSSTEPTGTIEPVRIAMTVSMIDDAIYTLMSMRRILTGDA